ncbi:MAG: NfeD family protein [Clostridia bacterium]|nr:NfeD family protein [Clostridia bacterium]
MYIVWLCAALLFVFLEALTVGINFIWFSAGALLAMVASFITDSIVVQLTVFVLASAVCLLAFRPLVKKKFNGKVTPTNSDRIIGQTGKVTEDIKNDENVGQILVSGQVWSAHSETGENILKDSYVTVTEIKGVRAVVRPADNKEE